MCNYCPVLRFSYLSVTMSRSSGLMDLRKFVFCFIIDVRIDSKIYLNVSELILKYLQNLSSSSSKSSRRLRNSPKPSRLELILWRLLHQILSMNIHASGLTSSQFRNVSCTGFSLSPLGLQCEWPLARPSSSRFGSACSVNVA